MNKAHINLISRCAIWIKYYVNGNVDDDDTGKVRFCVKYTLVVQYVGSGCSVASVFFSLIKGPKWIRFSSILNSMNATNRQAFIFDCFQNQLLYLTDKKRELRFGCLYFHDFEHYFILFTRTHTICVAVVTFSIQNNNQTKVDPFSSLCLWSFVGHGIERERWTVNQQTVLMFVYIYYYYYSIQFNSYK